VALSHVLLTARFFWANFLLDNFFFGMYKLNSLPGDFAEKGPEDTDPR
jgi:hypothetical protein